MSPTPRSGTEGRGLRFLGGTAGLANGIGQGEQVIGAGQQRVRVRSLPKHLPAAGGGETIRVLRAQVIAVRLRVDRQRAEHRGGVGVHVRERGDRRATATRSRAATSRTHGANRNPHPAPSRIATPGDLVCERDPVAATAPGGSAPGPPRPRNARTPDPTAGTPGGDPSGRLRRSGCRRRGDRAEAAGRRRDRSTTGVGTDSGRGGATRGDGTGRRPSGQWRHPCGTNGFPAPDRSQIRTRIGSLPTRPGGPTGTGGSPLRIRAGRTYRRLTSA